MVMKGMCKIGNADMEMKGAEDEMKIPFCPVGAVAILFLIGITMAPR